MRVVPDSCRLHPSVEVRTSDIAGRGLFATADLPAGTVVGRLGDRPVGDLAPADLPGNHSCDPNLGWADEYTLVTVADVGTDQELVTDYAMSVADPDFVLRCHCPSYRCRQMVAGDDWRIPQLQARYRGWWAPSVQGLVDGVSANPTATAGPPGDAARRPSSRRGP